LKEAGQRAISDAIKTSGNLAKNGDRLKIAVIADPMSDREQATYQARWTADNTPLDIPSDDEAPF
jgi:tRNA threonylcarbamoyladenosine modification (KEOPS) complex Cgi121 subunit